MNSEDTPSTPTFCEKPATSPTSSHGMEFANGNYITVDERETTESPKGVKKTRVKKKCPNGCFTKDCYTLIAMGDRSGVAWGLLVFFLQITGLFLIILSKIDPVLGENEDVDNPDQYYMARFINADESVLLLTTQVFAALVFVLFVDSSSSDVIWAIHVLRKCHDNSFEWESRRRKLRICVACLLKFSQGMLACLTALLLVIASSDVIDIILNFTAINYISELDENAFEMAQNGWISDSLKKWTDKINSVVDSSGVVDSQRGNSTRNSTDNATHSTIGKKQNTTTKTDTTFETYTASETYKTFESCTSIETMSETPTKESCRLGIGIIASVFFVLIVVAFSFQMSNRTWTTELLRVEFGDSHLQQYSGCYEAIERWSKDRKHDRRIVYTAWNSTHNATFAYCRQEKQWVFLQEDIDPCVLDEDKGKELAHSPDTFSFDISTVFDTPWFSPHANKHLDMYFYDNEENWKSPDNLHCTLHQQDGICNKELNEYAFNYDGGDCCATTCASENCGNASSIVFGGIGYGFPSCKDNMMIDVDTTIDIFEIHSVHKSSHFILTNGEKMDDDQWKNFWKSEEACSSNPHLDLVCNEKMVFSVKLNQDMQNLTETAKVSKDATCFITIDTFEPVFNVMTTESSAEKGINVIKTTRNSIPGALGNLANVEKLDFSGLALQGTIPSNLGNLTSILSLDLRNNALTGTIPSDLGNLTSILSLDLRDNALTGIIPTEIGMLTNLVALDLSGNDLTGEIPREIEFLTNLVALDLSGNPGLKGTIDCTSLNVESSICEQNNPQVWTLSPTKSTSPSVSSSPSESPKGWSWGWG